MAHRRSSSFGQHLPRVAGPKLSRASMRPSRGGEYLRRAARTLIVLIVAAATTTLVIHLAKHHAGAAHHFTVESIGSKAGGPVNVNINLSRQGAEFVTGAVGFSIESDELATNDLSAKHKSLVALMRQLGPSVLRLGGNSVDRSWWTSHDESAPAWATSTATPNDLSRLHALLLATHWKAILGIDLGHFDPPRAANEALAAKRILGSRLLGFEVGNEPDHYTRPGFQLRAAGYGPSNYLKELAIYRAAMEKSTGPISIYGPDLSTSAWLPALVQASPSPFTVITQHYYATHYSVASNACSATSVPAPTDLLSARVAESENGLLSELLSAGRIAQRPLRLSETGATGSCDTSGGPLTSPVFASALWALDWVLRTTSSGVSAINFHGYFGHCAPNSSSPVCAPTEADAERGQVIARPVYYGLLAARQLEGGAFLPTQVEGGIDLNSYATLHPGGLVTLAIDNWSPNIKARVLIELKGYKRMAVEPLTAPTIAATRISLGHSRLGPNGAFRPRQEIYKQRRGAFALSVPPESATIAIFTK
jgi:hypothetical protein